MLDSPDYRVLDAGNSRAAALITTRFWQRVIGKGWVPDGTLWIDPYCLKNGLSADWSQVDKTATV